MKQTMMEENPYRAMGEELVRLEQAGKLPEGFDLEAACQDYRFLELLQELEPYGAVRVYAAEKAAENAKAAARAELSQEALRQSQLPRQVRGNRALAAEDDYAAMSPEAFRALESRLRNHRA